MGMRRCSRGSDEIEIAWQLIDPVVRGWEQPDVPPLVTYEPGSWGPAEADAFLAREGRVWRHECRAHPENVRIGSGMMRDIEIYPTRAELMEAAAERLVTLTERSDQGARIVTVVLSGGSTPRELLHAVEARNRSCRSSIGEPARVLGRRTGRSSHASGQQLSPGGGCPVGKGPYLAGEYPPYSGRAGSCGCGHRLRACAAPLLRRCPGHTAQRAARSERPARAVDVVLLGMGADGHTASLFPGTTAVIERDRWVVPVAVRQLDRGVSP